mmetsp:Transcript_14575/g.24263  ORF Transcript_14575/g.24263 Transcript_14575/m.24263 type:complete len:283 (-) Transcript_14575:205-1053(-)
MDRLRLILDASISIEQESPTETFYQRPSFWRSVIVSFAIFCCSYFVSMIYVPWQFPQASCSSCIKIQKCLVSLMHNAWAMVGSTALLLLVQQPTGAPAALQHIPLPAIDFVGSVLVSFLVWDMLHSLLNWNLFSDELLEQMAHHGGFMLMMFLNGDTRWFNYIFPLLYYGELSTVFLNIRAICKELGTPVLVASALFALSFFATRVLVFGATIVHLFWNISTVLLLLSPSLQFSYLVMLPLLYLLNIYWFRGICRNVRRMLFKSARGPPQLHSQIKERALQD